MPRATCAVARHKRKKRLRKRAKGFVAGRGKLYRTMKHTVLRADAYAYRDRKVRKRDFRRLWIIRIGAAARMRGLSYSRFINGLTRAGVDINRKVLAELAATDEQAFDQYVDIAKTALAG